MRDRWHNALKNIDDGVEIDPDSVKIRNRWLYSFDAEADTISRWNQVSSKVTEELRTNNVSPLFSVQGLKATEVVEPQAA